MPVKLNGVYYGVKDAAKQIGRTEGRVRQMIRAEEIDAVEISPRVWLIPEREVKRIVRDREVLTAG